jgi:hypothetical protein
MWAKSWQTPLRCASASQCRGVDLRTLTLVGKVVVDALHQVTRCRHQRYTRRKAWPGVGSKLRRGAGRRLTQKRTRRQRQTVCWRSSESVLAPDPTATRCLAGVTWVDTRLRAITFSWVCAAWREKKTRVLPYTSTEAICVCGWAGIDLEAVADQSLAGSVERLQVGNMC